MHYMKRNASKHRLNTKNQPLLVSLFFNMETLKVGFVLKIYSQNSVTENFEDLEMDIDSLLRSWQEGTGRLYDLKRKQSGSAGYR